MKLAASLYLLITFAHCANFKLLMPKDILKIPKIVQNNDSNHLPLGVVPQVQKYHGVTDDDSNEYLINFNATSNKAKVAYCDKEVFQHSYIMPNGSTESVTNYWERTNAGEYATLYQLCLQSNGLPLTRLCFYNETNGEAKWQNISNWTAVKCFKKTLDPIISDKLKEMYENISQGSLRTTGVRERLEVGNLICDLLDQTNYKLMPADVHFTSQILKKMYEQAKEAELSPKIVNICNKVMMKSRKILRLSANINSTNILLDTFESYMNALSTKFVSQNLCDKTKQLSEELAASETSTTNNKIAENVTTKDYSHIGVFAHITSNISVFYINPSCANISGIALYDQKQAGVKNFYHEPLGNFYYRFIYMSETTQALMQEPNIQSATFLPQQLWQQVKTTLAAQTQYPAIVIKVYDDDALFVEQNLERTRKPFSQIISISIPGFNNKFSEDMPFILRNQEVSKSSTTSGTGCGYWNYETWVSDEVSTTASSSATVVLCGTRHLTQFSYLVGGDYRQSDLSGDVLISPLSQHVLDIITLVGCTLSLLGLIGIWISAALLPSWRTLASTKILLNLCVALTLQMVLFVFVNTEDVTSRMLNDGVYVDCIVLGAFMQYSLLVLFTWMLIVAYLQFQRYVTVLGIDRPKHYILKSAIAAWGFPLIPTLLVVFINPDTYIPSEYELRTDSGVCYPSGMSLVFGVLVPISLIVSSNLVVFIMVFYNISQSLRQSLQRQEKIMIIKQIRLSILLFFLLGLSWIFGIFAFMRAGIVFSYLFCLTATLQGFVLFVYFVLLDNVAQEAWMGLLCPGKVLKRKQKRVTDLQSMSTTSSTALESRVQR